LEEYDIEAAGIRLRVRDAGDPGGQPVIHFHGTPGCRRELSFADDIVAAAGVRIIAFDHPGYGGSTQTPFNLTSVATMAVQVADRLGVEEFRTTGWGADRSPWSPPLSPAGESGRSGSWPGLGPSSWFDLEAALENAPSLCRAIEPLLSKSDCAI
jgi:hypothetical protein